MLNRLALPYSIPKWLRNPLAKIVALLAFGDSFAAPGSLPFWIRRKVIFFLSLSKKSRAKPLRI